MPTKNKEKRKSNLEPKESFPAFGHKQEESMSFPELPIDNEPPKENENLRLQDELKFKKKNKTNRALAPNVKILDLQHNMMNIGSFPQMLFEDNGRIIDSITLREELKGINKSTKIKKQGRVIKPKNPMDMISVEYKLSEMSLPSFMS